MNNDKVKDIAKPFLMPDEWGNDVIYDYEQFAKAIIHAYVAEQKLEENRDV